MSIGHTTVETEGCISADDPMAGACAGAVEYHTSRSGLTTSKRCEKHQGELEDRLNDIDMRYPDSSVPPAWFDPTYAGESWDDDY